MLNSEFQAGLHEVAGAYLATLETTHSKEFADCVLLSCRVKAQLSLMHVQKTPEAEVEAYIQAESVKVGTLSALADLNPGEVIAEADKLYAMLEEKAGITS